MELYEILAELIRRSSENPYVGNPGKSRPEPIEKPVADFIESFLEMRGLAFQRVGIGERYNIVAEVGSGRTTIIFNGHMDTVPAGDPSRWAHGPFSAEREGDRVFGRGAADMKGGLAVFLKLLEDLLRLEDDLHTRIQFQFVVDEETGAASPFGTALLVERGYTGDFVIIGEPGAHKIANGHKGLYRFKITVEGEAVHTGLREWEQRRKGKNAILDMCKVVQCVQEVAKDLERNEHPLFPGRKNVLTFPTLIRGGTGINIVPDLCEAFGDCRLVSVRPEEVRARIESCLTGVKGSIEDIVKVPPAVADPKNKYIQRFRQIA